MRLFFCLIGLLFSCLLQAQSAYEKGYFIDLNNQKTECFIKPEAWSAHGALTYLMSYKEQPQTKLLSELSEVSIQGLFKLKRAKVQLDISGDESPLLSYTQDPEWHTEELFLWTLVDGNTSLYVYEGDGLTRFFISKANSTIEQLVYKKYRTTSGINLNEAFKQTLFEKVNCGDSLFTYFTALRYDEQTLIKHIVAENNCAGTSVQVYPKIQQETRPLPQTSILDAKENPKPETKKITPPAEPEPATTSSKEKLNYFGLEVNPLLRQIINLNPNSTPTNNPFGIQFASNSTHTGRGFGLGLTYARTKFSDDNNGVPRETVNRDVAFRIGYERKHQLGKRWIVLHGYDLVLGGSKSRTETNDPFFGGEFVTETKSNFWGLGPRVGLMFLLSDRVTLGTESTYYLRYIRDKTRLTGLPDSEGKTSEFVLTVPVVLVLSIRF